MAATELRPLNAATQLRTIARHMCAAIVFVFTQRWASRYGAQLAAHYANGGPALPGRRLRMRDEGRSQNTVACGRVSLSHFVRCIARACWCVWPILDTHAGTVAEGRRAPTAGGGAPDWATNAIHAESMPAMMGVSAASTTRGAPASNEGAQRQRGVNITTRVLLT